MRVRYNKPNHLAFHGGVVFHPGVNYLPSAALETLEPYEADLQALVASGDLLVFDDEPKHDQEVHHAADPKADEPKAEQPKPEQAPAKPKKSKR